MIPAVWILHALALVALGASIGGTVGRQDPPVGRLVALGCLIGATVCAAFGRPYP